MSTDKMDANIIPEFPIAKTIFLGSHSFGGVVDLVFFFFLDHIYCARGLHPKLHIGSRQGGKEGEWWAKH